MCIYIYIYIICVCDASNESRNNSGGRFSLMSKQNWEIEPSTAIYLDRVFRLEEAVFALYFLRWNRHGRVGDVTSL